MGMVYVLMAVVGAAAAIFALQNFDPVVIRFLGWRIEGAPLSMVILLSVLAGIVFTALVALVQQWKLRGICRAAPEPGRRSRAPQHRLVIDRVSSLGSTSQKALGNCSRGVLQV
jgi:uncharacterized integral membrane protein